MFVDGPEPLLLLKGAVDMLISPPARSPSQGCITHIAPRVRTAYQLGCTLVRTEMELLSAPHSLCLLPASAPVRRTLTTRKEQEGRFLARTTRLRRKQKRGVPVWTVLCGRARQIVARLAATCHLRPIVPSAPLTGGRSPRKMERKEQNHLSSSPATPSQLGKSCPLLIATGSQLARNCPLPAQKRVVLHREV